MLKTAAIIFGIFFIVAGIAGFVPALAPDGMLFGLFMVNAVHNIVHVASGAAALICAFTGTGASRKYFQIFGAVYGLVAVLGFFYGNSPLLGVMAHNNHDIWLHILISGAALYLGFMADRDTVSAAR